MTTKTEGENRKPKPYILGLQKNGATIRRNKHFKKGLTLAALVFVLSIIFIATHPNNSLAAQPLKATSPAVYNDSQLLVKLKSSTRGEVKSSAADTGVASLNNTFKNKKVNKFERIANPGKKSLAGNPIFDWYKVSVDPNAVQTKIDQNGKVTNITLQNLKNSLSQDPNVAAVEEDYQATTQTVPNDPYYASFGSWGQSYSDMWGLKAISPEGAWSITTGSKSIAIADVDTGVDINNPDIASNIWTNPGEIPGNGIDDDGNGYVDDVHGWNWVSNNNNVIDDNGHGTHTAGTIGAAGNNGQGVVGVNWTTNIMPLKSLDNNGQGSLDNLAKALVYAADMGARVSSNSWGCSCHSQIIDNAIAYEHDHNMVAVAAAGNNYNADALDFSPASSDGAITVGASDTNNQLASFSNSGSRIDVVAPGVDILSLKASNSPVCASYIVGGNYCRLSGTSMATPHVSGLAALMLASNPSLSNEDVRQILRTSTTDLGTAGRDTSFGYGLINATNAVTQATAAPPSVYIASPSSRSSMGSSPISVIGTAGGNGFASFKLEIGAGRSPATLTQLASSTTPVQNGILGTINPANLDDGTYTLRLTVTNTSGKTFVYEMYDLTVDNINAGLTLPINLVPVGQTAINGTAMANNGQAFNKYTIDYGVGTAPTSWITTGIGTSTSTTPVNASTLSSWDTSSLADGQTYTLRLTVTLSSGAKDVYKVKLTADKNLVSGWPIQLDTPSCQSSCDGTPAFADLNNDGQKELIVASPGSNKVYAYRRDGSQMPGFPVTVTAGDWFKWPVTIADVNNDGFPEIVASAITPDKNSRLYIINKNGQLLPGWPTPTFNTNGQSATSDITPTIADLDGDGVKEIVTLDIFFPGSGSVQHTLHAMHADGTEISGFPKELPIQNSFMQYPLTIADLDKDGRPEIAVGNYDKSYLFDNQGNLLPGWPYQAPLVNGQMETFQSTPSIGDIDGDGQLEVFSTATPNGALGVQLPLYAWKKSGALVSGFPQQTGQYGNYHSGWPLNNTATADIDNDGKDEVVVGNNNLTIHKLSGPMNLTPAVGMGSVTLSDFTGDGNLKISAGRFSQQDAIQLLNTDGSVFYHKDTAVNNTFMDPFVSADMNKNGKLEYASIMSFANAPGAYVYVWEMPSGASGSWPISEWPMFGQNPAMTNHFTRGSRDVTPPTVSITTPANNAQVSGSVNVSATASDNFAVAKVEFYVDGQLASTSSSSPYNFTWNSNTVTNGTHTIMAKAYDTANLTATSSVTVSVNNNAGDITPPTVSITHPADNSNVAKNASFLITATASDNVRVSKVEFYVNGTLICSGTTTPYSCNYTTGPQSGATYTVMAKAYDTSGNTNSSTITVKTK